jgi:hypothetical protein
MDATGVIADHAAERAAIVRGRVRCEREAVAFGSGTKVIENHSGLYSREPAAGINSKNPSHVFREIDNDSNIAALSGERCATTSGQEGSPILPT